MSAEPWYAGHRPTRHPKPNPIAFLATIHAPEWMNQARCVKSDPAPFFPDRSGPTVEAKKICMTCDVRPECLAYALETGERHGIWGGLSELERRRVKHNPAAQPRPCEREGCTETIPLEASARRRYHDAACANLGRQDDLIATLDPKPILAAYADGSSVTVISARQQIPVSVVSRLLAQHGVRKIRRRDEEATG